MTDSKPKNDSDMKKDEKKKDPVEFEVTYRQLNDAQQSWEKLDNHNWKKGTFAYKISMGTVAVADVFRDFNKATSDLIRKFKDKDEGFRKKSVFLDFETEKEFQDEQEKLLDIEVKIPGKRFAYYEANFGEEFFTGKDFRVLSPFINFIDQG